MSKEVILMVEFELSGDFEHLPLNEVRAELAKALQTKVSLLSLEGVRRTKEGFFVTFRERRGRSEVIHRIKILPDRSGMYRLAQVDTMPR